MWRVENLLSRSACFLDSWLGTFDCRLPRDKKIRSAVLAHTATASLQRSCGFRRLKTNLRFRKHEVTSSKNVIPKKSLFQVCLALDLFHQTQVKQSSYGRQVNISRFWNTARIFEIGQTRLARICLRFSLFRNSSRHLQKIPVTTGRNLWRLFYTGNRTGVRYLA